MAMNCKHCKDWKKHFYWNHFETRRLHFGKAMDGDFFEHMIIPKKFIKNFREELSQTIELKGPSGNIWHVRLLKIAGDIVMGNGWKDFVKDNYINKDDYLVFKYDGNSRFNVLIFYETGCEKESSYFVKNSISKVNEPCQLGREVAEDSLNILHESMPPEDCDCHSPRNSCDKRQEKLHFSGTCNSPQINANKKVGAGSSHFKRQGRDVQNADQMSRPTKAAKHNDKKKKESITTMRQVTDVEKARALHRANAIRPTNPFFVKVLQASHVGRCCYLNFPYLFTSAHVPPMQQTIFLRLPNGEKTWSASYLVYYSGAGLCSGLRGGWLEFVQDNNLEEGDASAFELTRATEELVMLVHIFRAVDEISPAKREA